MTLVRLFERTLAAHGERVAVRRGAVPVLGYRQLGARVMGLAASLLAACGGRDGERVMLVLPNSVAYVELMLAAWWAGLAPVPVHAKLHPRELAWILEDSGARVCVSAGDLLAGLRAASAGAEAVFVDACAPAYEALAAAAPMPPAQPAEDDLAWMFYTSGTTGRPKGVMLSHANLVAMAMCFHADVMAVDHRDALLHVAPMSHGGGMYAIPYWMRGAAQVIPDSGGFDAGELFRIAAEVPDLSLFASPTIVRRMVREVQAGSPIGHLKTVVVGGAPFYVEDVREAVAVLGPRVAQIYGQGESPMTITAQPAPVIAEAAAAGDEELLGSVGTRQSLVEVAILDAADRALPPGEAGEVAVRGATVMRGYWRNPEASAKTLAGGWLHTGDVGLLTARGHLILKDRSRDVIISGGSNIYPREVEEVLLSHPDVAEAAVLGCPDAEWGEAVWAFVVPRAGAVVTTGALDLLCLERIARFKRPKRYFFVEALPRNSTGKVLKTELRARLAAIEA